jgi:protein-disulfide isomerase
MSMSKRQEIRDRRRKQQIRNRTIVILMVVVGALLVAFALIYPSIKPVGPIATTVPNPRPLAKDNAMGDPNSPVKIIEFSDFQCPYCARFHQETEQQIVDMYVSTGKVYFVYRSYGAWIGAESQKAAEAAYCAGDQNKFWEYHDILFNNQSGENVGDFANDRLNAFASTLGLDMNQFKACFNSGKYTERVLQDGTDGKAAGITGTPGFTVNGQLIDGAQPFSVFQTAIDTALAGH